MSTLPSFCETKRWVREVMANMHQPCSSRESHSIARICLAIWAGDLEPTIVYQDPTGAEAVRRVLAMREAVAA